MAKKTEEFPGRWHATKGFAKILIHILLGRKRARRMGAGSTETHLVFRGPFRQKEVPWGEVEALVQVPRGKAIMLKVTNRGMLNLPWATLDAGAELVQTIRDRTGLEITKKG